MEFDDFDRRLLAALQRDNRQTGEELADLAGLSPAACLRPVQKLRDGGVIERDVSILAPAAVGRNLMVIVLVTLERDPLHVVDRFKGDMQKAPEGMQCYYVTGPADYVVVLTVEDMAAYEDFTRRYFFVPHIKRFDSLMVMNRAKFETALPVA